jgi:hypothetical protein
MILIIVEHCVLKLQMTVKLIWLNLPFMC